jgi:hypothetical protein
VHVYLNVKHTHTQKENKERKEREEKEKGRKKYLKNMCQLLMNLKCLNKRLSQKPFKCL